MFDFGVYVGPIIVILGMLLALIGFAFWGSGAIRESAEEALAAAAQEKPAGEGNAKGGLTDLSLPDLPVISAEMEKTAEFSQPLDIVPTFSQSFLEGQELAPGGQAADYNAAIDRIKADLEASDSEEAAPENNQNNNQDTEEAFFDYGAEDFAAVDVYGAEAYLSDEAADTAEAEIIEAANVVEALNSHQEPPDAGAAALPDNNASKPADNIAAEPANELDTAETSPEEIPGDSASEDMATDTSQIGSPEQSGSELTDLERAAMEETMILKYPKQTTPQAAETEILDATALEETRLHRNVAVPTNGADSEAKGAAAVSAVDLAGLEDMSEDGILIPETPIAFGSRMAWLAIPGFKPSEVIALLRLGDVKSANWTMGLTQAYADNNQVFVSPSLGGWVLVIGKTLWQKADMNRSAENIPWLKDIGRRFGNVCFFSTMKGLGNHGWIGIRDGQIARAYGYSGELQELIWFVGEPTEEEEIINPAFVDEAQEKYQPGFRPVIPDEKLVLAMAAAWSVDTSFKRRQYPPDFGFLGTMT